MSETNSSKIGFDGNKYIELQKNQISDRLVNIAGKLYLQIENLIKDDCTANILPGYFDDSLKRIFSDFRDKSDILVCINADDITGDTKFGEDNLSLGDFIEHRLLVLERNFGTKPVLVITNIDIGNMFDLILNFERRFQKKQYRVFEKYKISGYPYNLKSMLSEDGFGSDDHIPLTKNLILVTGVGKNSGKFSTCLGQIYMDNEIGIRAGYAKYQTFPVRNLPINHPVNLAYQAMNLGSEYEMVVDELHKKAYNQECITTKKDAESFQILQDFAKSTVNHKNYMIKYNSSIDMSINCIGMCISDEDNMVSACLEFISKQKDKYEKDLDEENVKKCAELYDLASQWKK